MTFEEAIGYAADLFGEDVIVVMTSESRHGVSSVHTNGILKPGFGPTELAAAHENGVADIVTFRFEDTAGSVAIDPEDFVDARVSNGIVVFTLGDCEIKIAPHRPRES